MNNNLFITLAGDRMDRFERHNIANENYGNKDFQFISLAMGLIKAVEAMDNSLNAIAITEYSLERAIYIAEQFKRLSDRMVMINDINVRKLNEN